MAARCGCGRAADLTLLLLLCNCPAVFAVICCNVHLQGVFIWRSAKTSELLKALLLRQPADTEGPPAQQHSPVSAGRRCADAVGVLSSVAVRALVCVALLCCTRIWLQGYGGSVVHGCTRP